MITSFAPIFHFEIGQISRYAPIFKAKTRTKITDSRMYIYESAITKKSTTKIVLPSVFAILHFDLLEKISNVKKITSRFANQNL